MTFKHGFARSGRVERLHKIWRKMLARCNTDLSSPHPRYAGRGISVCAEWKDYLPYLPFREWAMSNGYATGLTIERVDNDGPYSPGNCCWVTRADQTRNRTTSKRITFNGRTAVQSVWARELGIDATLIHWRLKQGWPLERVLSPARAAYP